MPPKPIVNLWGKKGGGGENVYPKLSNSFSGLSVPIFWILWIELVFFRIIFEKISSAFNIVTYSEWK
jgi:hypothetical protein